MHTLLRFRPTSLDSLADALASEADALVIDLAPDSTDPADRATLDALVATLERLRGDEGRALILVAVGLGSPTLDADLRTVLAAEPDGVFLREAESAADVEHLGAKLAVAEAELDLPDGGTLVLAEVGTSPGGALALGGTAMPSGRLLGLASAGAALGTALGVADGAEPVRLARSLTVLAAQAADLAAIEGASGEGGAAFEAICEAARRDGFNGKIARTAEQVRTVAAVFGREG